MRKTKKSLIALIAAAITISGTTQAFASANVESSVCHEQQTIFQVVPNVMSNGLTVQSAARVPNTDYARIVFKNSNNTTLTDTVYATDFPDSFVVLSSFNLSVSANSTKSVDVYVGSYTSFCLLTDNHGYSCHTISAP